MWSLVAALVWLIAIPAVAQVQPDPSSADRKSVDQTRERRVRFTFDGSPSVRISKLLRLDVHVKSQADLRDFPSEPDTSPKEVFDLHRARVGVDGTFLRYFEYQVERELHDAQGPWRDVYVNARPLRALQLQGGNFKMPFSLDRLTGSMDLDFTYRSLAATYLAPGRDVGVMAHGSVFKDGLKYQAGVFRQGGENVRASERTDPQSQRTVAGRVVVRPWDSTRTLRPLRTLAVGASFTAGHVPEGLNSLRGKTVPGDPFFDRVYVNGPRRRVGAELEWRPGPATVQSEVMRVNDQRRGQGIDDEDLADAVATGWYLSGTWLVTGEHKKDTINPSKPFLKGGIGALELAGRLENLSSASGASNGPLAGPRARILDKVDGVWTVGVNWYLNRFVKVQANLIRERREEGGIVSPAEGRLWSRTVRFQFGL